MTESETQNPQNNTKKNKKKHSHNPFHGFGKILKKPFQSHHKQSKNHAHAEHAPTPLQTTISIEQPDAANPTPVTGHHAHKRSEISSMKPEHAMHDHNQNDQTKIPAGSLRDSETNTPPTYLSPHAVPSEASTWNGFINLEDPEAEISPGTNESEQNEAKKVGLASRGYAFNQTLEQYVPGWRFLMHFLLIPVIEHNIKAGDIWVGSLSAMLNKNVQNPTELLPERSLLVKHRMSQHRDSENDSITLSELGMDHTVIPETALSAKAKPM